MERHGERSDDRRDVQSGAPVRVFSDDDGIAARKNLDTILASIQEHPQIHCPVMGDTVTITGQVSIRYVNGLNLPELRARRFPNRLQPICILVEPYIGAGVGRVDRVAGVAHIWLASPKQRDAHGNIDWTRPEPIATGIVLELAGKLIAQGVNRLSDSGDPLAGEFL